MTINSTLNYYEKNAEKFIEQTIRVNMHALYLPFIDNLPNSAPNEQHILDLGCGSGRDSFYFSEKNFKVTAIDGSQKLIDFVKTRSKDYNGYKLDIEWQCLSFSQLNEQKWHKKFTGIWACASLLHVPYAELPSIINILLDMLTSNGVIYMSFKYGDSERTDNNRFFCDLNEDRWSFVKAQLNKNIEDTVWITEDKRLDRDDKWINMLIRVS